MAKGCYVGVAGGIDVLDSNISTGVFANLGNGTGSSSAPLYNESSSQYYFENPEFSGISASDFSDEVLMAGISQAWFIATNDQSVYYMYNGSWRKYKRGTSGGVARKVKAGYVGVTTEVPIYETVTKPVMITASNIANYFEVTNSSYYFAGSGEVFTANNLGVNSSTATTALKLKQDVTNLLFQYQYITEANYDKFTIKVGSTTVLSAVSGTTSGATLTTYNAGDLTAGTTLTFSYTKDSSQHASGETCLFKGMSFTTETKTQTGTETKQLARKIKKAYVGVGGVARPCWGGGTLTSYGAITSLSYTREDLAATTVSNYALFGGGYNGARKSTVDTYTADLTHSTATSLNTARSSLAATTVGDYALFGGGATAGSTYSSVVDAYTANLTHSTATSLGTARKQLAAVTTGDYAMFAGGYGDNGSLSVVDIFNKSLTKGVGVGLSTDRYLLAATTIGDYALFGGGHSDTSGDNSAVLDVYEAASTRLTPTSLSTGRYRLAATTVGNYALFAGGYNNSSYYDVVDAYNTSLTRITATALTIGRYLPAAVTIGDYALFGGGYNGSLKDVVDVYDSSLTKQASKQLSVARYKPVATTVGNYALFAGGHGYSSVSTYSKVVDAFTVV